MDINTVTVPNHYSFLSTLSDEDERRDAESNYNVTIVVTPSGSYEVTGERRDVKSFIDDICVGDPISVDRIMKTAW